MNLVSKSLTQTRLLVLIVRNGTSNSSAACGRTISSSAQTPVNAGQHLLIGNAFDAALFHRPHAGLNLSLPNCIHVRIRTRVVQLYQQSHQREPLVAWQANGLTGQLLPAAYS